MVEADFRKKDINLEDCDYLIVDFIDERFNIVDFENSKITLSHELSKVIDQIGDVDISFKRGSDEDFTHWREVCKKFSKYFAGEKNHLAFESLRVPSIIGRFIARKR